MEANNKINDVREHFSNEYPYVDLGMLSDDTINAFLNQGYIASLWFERQMDCLYDYILSQDLCGVEE
jgi:hypothetical protein